MKLKLLNKDTFKISYLILGVLLNMSLFGQNNLTMSNNQIWPNDFSPVYETYDNITMGNNTTLNVSTATNLVVNSNLTGNNGVVINIVGSLRVKGKLIFNNNSAATISGNIIVDGDVEFNNGASLTVDGDFTVNGNFNVASNAEVNVDGTMDVAGDFTAGSGTVIDGTGVIDIDGTANLDPTVVIGSNVTVNSGALPVSLINFSVSTMRGNLELAWVTASEVNNDYFTIEKSNNGVDWTPVAVVDGRGNSNQVNSYSYVVGLEDKANYYRLKQTDFDGQFAYVGMVNVSSVNEKGMDVVKIKGANTVNNHVQAFVFADNDMDVVVKIYDIQGNELLSENKTMVKGDNFISLPLTLYKGLYIINVANNNSRDVKKIIL